MRVWPPVWIVLASSLALAACPGPPIVPEPSEPSNAVVPPMPPSARTPAPTPDPAPPTFRLPGDVAPRAQTVELTIRPGEPRASGSFHIDAMIEYRTRVVWMHAIDLHVHDAKIGDRPARVIAAGDFVGLVADADLPAGPTTLDGAFDAPIDAERSRGMYSSPDGKDSYVYTFFEPIDARRAFPCFDEPVYKIPWTLIFHVPAHDVALGNAPVVKETPEPADMKRVELAPTRPLPSYVVAFVVGPFAVVDGGKIGRAGTPLRFILPRDKPVAQLAWARQITPRIVAALESYFDMPYPYGKLDVAVVPRYWGTMEHPGIVAMGQPLALIAPDQDTRARRQHYANILAHELSHYWFGDLVTMAWWDDTWLNESFGTWLDMVITNAVMPGWHYPDDRVQIAAGAMSADENASARPIHRAVTAGDGIEGSFDNQSTYFKGASAIRATEAFVGADAWRDFMRNYVMRHLDRSENESDFMNELRAALGVPAAAMFETYITRPGVPVVRVRAECGGDHPHLAIERARSLPMGVADPSPRPWPIPVCVRYGDAKHAEQACATGDALPLKGTTCPTWIEPNAGASGYYRSVVDPALLAARSPAKLTGAEKQMAIHDLGAMVLRGELSSDQLLEQLPALADDPDAHVAIAAIHATHTRADGLDDATYAAYRRWRHDAIAPLARRLGWQRGGDSDEREQLREAALGAAAADDPELERGAVALADAWLKTHAKVDDGLISLALGVAARHGDAARFDRYVAAAKATTDTADRTRLLASLGQFQAPELVQRALALVLGQDFDVRDSGGILLGLLGARETRDAALAFLREHIDDVLGRLRDDEKTWLLSAIAGEYCDAPHRDAAEQLVAQRAQKVDGAELPIARGLESAATCIQTLAREREAIERVVSAKK